MNTPSTTPSSGDLPHVLLAHHLKALKLPTFLREYDKVARQGAAEGIDHPRYLLRLTELELIERERRMVERRIVQGDGGAALRDLGQNADHFAPGVHVKLLQRAAFGFGSAVHAAGA